MLSNGDPSDDEAHSPLTLRAFPFEKIPDDTSSYGPASPDVQPPDVSIFN